MVAIDDIGMARLGEQPPPGQAELGRERASWRAWGTTASVTVTDPAALAPARRLVAKQIAATAAAAGRDRGNAEIHRLYRAGGRAITISSLLADLVAAALITAERTGGDVDPTVNGAINALSGVPSLPSLRGPIPICEHVTKPRPVPGWEVVQLHGRRLQVPAGVTLDLTATAKAVALDRAAARVADRLGTGVLVQLGSDAVSAGPAPQDGWRVVVRNRAGDGQAVVHLPPGAALSSAYVTGRPDASRRPGVHLINPRTGLPPDAVHQQASVLAFSGLEAAAYAAAALVRGMSARSWLTQLWVPARLVTVDGGVILAGPWAAHQPVPDPIDRIVPVPRLANPRRTTL